MKFTARLKSFMRSSKENHYNKRHAIYDCDLSFTQAVATFPDPNILHAYMHHYLRYRCPQLLRDHRRYFMQKRRGFGEDAFHSMWWLLLQEFSPKKMLEIGVFRGQVISLWALICQHLQKRSLEIHGISPFSPLGDSVSDYPKEIDYLSDVIETFRFWNLAVPVLVKALSTDTKAIVHISSRNWNLIYIDGSHDYEVALADYRLCRDCLAPGGLLVLDDASLYTSFRPPTFSFAGHPGPSRVAREHADKEMRFLGAVGHNNVYLNE